MSDLMAAGSFSGPLVIRETAGTDVWQIVDPFAYCTTAGLIVTVPAGFETDFASVPRPLWWLYSPFDHGYRGAAVIHDYLYANAELFPGGDDGHISRRDADAIFREAMQASGFRRSGRFTIWLAVRAGGFGIWRRYRQFADAA